MSLCLPVAAALLTLATTAIAADKPSASGTFEIEKLDAKSVAGTFKCKEHDVTFDAPVLATPKK